MATKIRRVVTGHDKSGKAVVLKDATAKRVVNVPGGIADTLLWVNDSTPAKLHDDQDQGERDVGIPPPAGGAIFRTVEFPPEKDSPPQDAAALQARAGHGPVAGGAPPRHPGMHRTKTIDYAVVIEGEIDMLLDDSEVHLEPGDVLVQQGTNHAWVNRGDKPCLIAFVLIDAERDGPKS
jgi:mannose-6-phosphate isomerase-like protein (cupin superfamily)